MTYEGIAVQEENRTNFKKSHPWLHAFEKKILDQAVDKYSNMLVRRIGFRKARWVPCVKTLLLILLVLNVISCYARPDFTT
jgi:hypothetical protein